ncbi:MAG: hypothetical protein A2754_00015 [Candidatus Magasanikbacteria bacterium RIFCSPHIGHO2_01_FULL_47_8]|uniref:NAD kinase n=1 Tax=Candidatus Magasanikbacteria bacterium RIFCSPHIGHO2_01_FULL_47_8 TaxID=1798673 RepID=A0A1F6MAZ3_9BACT|nr:MAG: hypothetical protein A2754_00015 [Candidatus Magasanikbacteria bacterium RIFCSPHIGHO2_01_FULL_47_8]
MKFIIVYDTWKPDAEKLAEKISDWLSGLEIEHDSYKDMFPTNEEHDPDRIALLLGGDGFIVKNILPLAKENIPFLGVNFGTVGFLAPVEPKDWKAAINKILKGKYHIDRKKILDGSIKSSGKTTHFKAVNDAVLFRGENKFIRMKVSVDGYPVHKELGGDGIIVSSAIGSPAYNLAAKGPIAEVGLIVTPLSIPRINVASMVLGEDRIVEIKCLGGSRPYEKEFPLEVDGDNTRRIKTGDVIAIRYGDLRAKFIIPEGSIFIKSLHNKLGLSK